MTRRSNLLAAILGFSVMAAAGGCTELDVGDGSGSLVLKDPNFDPYALEAMLLSPESGSAPMISHLPGRYFQGWEGTVSWARSYGGARMDIAEGMALGRFGSLVLTGSIADSVDFGNGPTESTGYDQAFVAVYNTAGRHLWADCTGGYGDHHGRAVATDLDGSVYIAGDFAGRMEIGGHVHEALGRTDAFVAKYSVNGGLQWVRVFGGDGDESARTIAIDASGNVVVAGTFDGSLAIDDFEITRLGGVDVFIAALDAKGIVVGARSIGGPTDDAVSSVAVNRSGGYAVALTYINSDTGKRNAAIAMLHRESTLSWMRQFTGFGDNEINGVTFDTHDDVYVVGSYTEKMVTRDAEFPLAANRDGFVIVFSAEGDTRWNHRMGSTGNDTATAVALDPSRGLVIAGTLTEPTYGETDLFVLQTTVNGRALWGRVFGGGGRDTITAAVTDLAGHAIVTGSFERAVGFDRTKLDSQGEGDLFLLSIVQ